MKAHEVAHHFVGGDVEGCTVLSEVLAQYSSTMVMEKEFDPKLIQDFLDREQDRYLKGRANEQLKERNLLHVRSYKGSIHYGKAALPFTRCRITLEKSALTRLYRNLLENMHSRSRLL